MGNYLHELCARNDARGIKTVFFWGGHSNEVMTKNQKKALEKKMSEGRKIYVFDYGRYLWGERTSGIVWWDTDHLTPYGQELAGTYIFNKIKKHVIESSEKHHY